RPTLNQYVATRPELVAASERLFSAVKTGTVKIRIGGRYPLAEAARAHRDLEARRTTGSLVLLP
ncbi:MAG TPA: zinc-binding dehydrogenase, partial [Polyangiaceae bacterium]|nr:zinc-binding dehydrogenase [Polyangiaceae bacterium]